MVKLYLGGFEEAHYMLGPVLASFTFLFPHWWRIEANWRNRLATLPLLLLQCWPQYQACKILFLGLVKKVGSWRVEKENSEKGIGPIGKIQYFLCI